MCVIDWPTEWIDLQQKLSLFNFFASWLYVVLWQPHKRKINLDLDSYCWIPPDMAATRFVYLSCLQQFSTMFVTASEVLRCVSESFKKRLSVLHSPRRIRKYKTVYFWLTKSSPASITTDCLGSQTQNGIDNPIFKINHRLYKQLKGKYLTYVAYLTNEPRKPGRQNTPLLRCHWWGLKSWSTGKNNILAVT